jgi:hypothetical protein
LRHSERIRDFIKTVHYQAAESNECKPIEGENAGRYRFTLNDQHVMYIGGIAVLDGGDSQMVHDVLELANIEARATLGTSHGAPVLF